MNLNSFTYVAEIERCGSINRAAQNLYTSQSNLSTALKSLEEELGYPIFKRTSNGSVPTQEGYLFIQSAKAILAEIEKINEIPQRIGEEDTISISCNWSAQILQSLVEFKENRTPEARDAYRETSIKQNFECLYENQYRLAIIDCLSSLTEDYLRHADNTNLEVQMLDRTVPAVALLSQNHPLAGRESLTMKEIYTYPLVLFEDYRDADQHDAMRLQPHHQILYLYDRGSILDVLQSSNSISILKKNTFMDPAQYSMVELPISDCPDTYDIMLLKRRYYQLNHREEEFIQYLKAQL